MEDMDPILNEYLYEIINQAQYGITICNPNREDNPIIFVNEAFTEIFGYTKEEVLGRNCRFLQNDEHEQLNLQKIRNAIKNKKATTTVLRNFKKNGDLVYNEIRVSPIFDKSGELIYFLGVQKDITDSMAFSDYANSSHIFDKEFKEGEYSIDDFKMLLNELSVYQAEMLAQNSELLEKEKRLTTLNKEFYTLFEEAPIPFLLVDKHLQIIKYNKESDEIFSFSESKLRIKSMFQVVDKSSISDLVKWMSHKRYLHENLDIAMVRANTKKSMFRIRAKLYGVDSNLLIITLVDVQKDYDIQKDLNRLIDAQKIVSLEQNALIEKNSRLATMGEMIDAIAHQWKQPLGIISMRTNFLYEMSEDEHVKISEVLECKDAVISQIEHLVATLEHFRDFLRPSSSMEDFDLEETLMSTLVLIKDEMMQYNIDINIDCKNSIVLKGFKNEFKHVVLNILSNAKDIFLQREVNERFIDVKAYTKGTNDIIIIEDNAGGIPQSILHNVFENHVSEKVGGTGIGLYMSHQFIKKMGGDIYASNVEFRHTKTIGAQFTIIIPHPL